MTFVDCWASDSHGRPGFNEILIALDEVRSAFAATPHESFHTMQEDWRLEIEQVLHGLRMKEKVRVSNHYQQRETKTIMIFILNIIIFLMRIRHVDHWKR